MVLPNSYAISSSYIIGYFNSKGYKLKRYNIGELNQNLVLEKIIDAVNNDKPVILLQDDRIIDYIKYFSDVEFDRNGFLCTQFIASLSL